MSALNNSLLLGAAPAAAYTVSRSLRFNSADSAYLSRTPASAGNRKTWTWSGWVKRSKLGAVQYGLLGANNASFFFTFHDGDGADGLRVYSLDNAGSTLICNLITTNKFRDPSAWYHILLAIDTTQATDTNRVKIYVNNSQITTFSTAIYPSQNDDLWVNSATAHRLGALTNVGGLRFDGYLADCYLIDGQQLTPSSFGETNATTGQWVPRQFSGTYGTNGFKLTFSDNSNTTAATLGADTSGNGNNWTLSGFSVTAGAGNDSLVDTPTSYGAANDTGAGAEIRGNYATWNPLKTAATFTNGNLDITNTTGLVSRTTIGVSSGKFYCEYTINSASVALGPKWGIANDAFTVYGALRAKAGTSVGQGMTVTINNHTTNITSGTLGIALDMNASECKIYHNNSLKATLTSIPADTYFFYIEGDQNTDSVTLNAGQRPFVYTAPSGFKALCDTNLTAPTIAKPNTVMDTVLYTGTGASLTPTSTLSFSPDLVWIKSRSAATDHALYDTVRGATKDMASNTTAVETTETQGLTAFNSNGFTVGTLAKLNTNAATYAGWCWDAGSSNATNTNGTITSTCRTNVSAGFSIVTYTGTGSNATVGHSLGVAPQLVVVKRRDNAAGSWLTWHTSIAATDYLAWNSTAAVTTLATVWNSTAPTSSVFSIGTSAGVNTSASNYVAYCWAPVAGYSAFGSYTGNGSSDGPFVYTGFRPRWVMVKKTNSASISDWVIQDAGRDTYNPSIYRLYSNLSNAEDSGSSIDFLSNGFKIRVPSAYANINETSSTYIYAAFAEAPFPYARAR